MAWGWWNALKGLGQGAVGGGTAGLATGNPLAALLGAAAGGVAGGISGGLSGDSPEVSASGFENAPSRFTAEQQDALRLLLALGYKNLQDPYAGFEPIEKHATQRFKSQTLPGIAERFAGLGDTRGSSGVLGSLGGAASDFEQGMAALRSQFGQQSQQNALRQLQLGLTPQFEQIYFGRPALVGNQLMELGGKSLGRFIESGGLNDLLGQRGATKSGTSFTPKEASYLTNLLRSQTGKVGCKGGSCSINKGV